MNTTSELNYNKGSLSILEFLAFKKSGAPFQMIDVRQPEEYAEYSIEGAVLIPLDTIESAIDKLNRDVTVILHCRSGKRSAKAQQILKGNGFEKTFNLDGGIIAWNNYFNKEDIK
jgi:phage shock protein E